jgi:hypothetical protein
MNMNREPEIWGWLTSAKAAGISTRSDAAAIERSLERLPASAKSMLAAEYSILHAKADSLMVWEACSLMLGSPASDDWFEYFRNWLLWSGRRVFSTAIENADDLEEVCRAENVDTLNPFFEPLSVLASYSDVDIPAPNKPLGMDQFTGRGWNWMDSSPERIAADLPKLWQIYGDRFQWELESPEGGASCEAPGLGTVKLGDRLLHRAGYGVGVVENVLVAEASIVAIAFVDQTRSMRVTSEHFERAPSGGDA